MGLVRRGVVWTVGLSGLLVASVLASATVGPVDLGYGTVAKVALNAVALPASVGVAVRPGTLPLFALRVPVPTLEVGYVSPFAFEVPRASRVIVMQLRLPRIVLGAVVGFALAAAGTIMQGFFRNPMADPSIIGVSTGAAVGAVATIVFGLSLPFGLGLQATAFCGAVLTAFGVYFIAREGGRTPVATLLLAGVAVQTFLGAVISVVLLYAGHHLREALYWLMGHLHASTWAEVAMTLPLVVVTFFAMFALAGDLNVLLLGEEDAHTLGVEVERTKWILLALSSVITALAVAVAGVVGFVGLIVPHGMRLLVGPDHRLLLPTSALAGAVFLVVTDTVARSGAAELPVGVVTAALGAPFFLYLLRTREVHAL